MKHDVFLSHNSQDKTIIEQIARGLEERGVKVWFDQWDLVAGESSQGGLESGLQDCQTCAVFIGKHGIGAWQDKERKSFEYFTSDNSRRVIPVLLAGATERDIPPLLKDLHRVDFRNGVDAEALYQLACGIKGIAPRPNFESQPPLPTDDIPAPADLPVGSRVPHGPNPLFTGRVEMFKQLALALTPSPSPTFQSAESGRGESAAVVITQAVTGMGGIGKTQLAVEFAHRYGKYFRGAHWLNLAELSLFESEIAECGRKMRLPNFPEDHQPTQVELTLQAWMKDGPRLVILDNFEEPARAHEILARLRHSNIRVLITSRRADWLPTLNLNPIALNLFTPKESADFLQRALEKRKDSAADLSLLAERLGHLPLGLELASRYLNYHPRLNVGKYLEQANDALEHESMQAWREEWLGKTATQHDTSLLGTFALSWEMLLGKSGGRVGRGVSRDRIAKSPKGETTEALDANGGLDTSAAKSASDYSTTDAAQKIFMSAGYLAPNAPIPLEIFEGALELAPEACDEAMQDLYGLGLLKQEENGLPSIHPLLANYARKLGKVDEKILAVLVNTLATLSTKANDTEIPADFNAIKPHIPTLAEFAEAAKPEDAGALWNNYGYHLNMIADYAGAREMYERALKIAEIAFGSEHSNFATAVNNLGSVMEALGDLNGAHAMYERALKIDEANFGPDHPKVATDVNNLGCVMQALGDLNSARAMYERALKIDEANFGPDHSYITRDVNNLGGVMYDLGDLNGARTMYERALKIDEAAFGPDHPNVAIRINNLGMVMKAIGNLNGAREMLQRALKIWESQLGENHPNVVSCVRNLDSVLQDLGDLNGAREMLERALKIDEANFGPDHPNVAIDLNNLGTRMQALGDLNGAREMHERALKIDEANFGSDHPNIATYVNNLGCVMQALGDLKGACEMYERALKILETQLGENHPNVAGCLSNLGMVMKALGDLNGAREMLERALAILKKFLPPDHPNIKVVQGNLESLPSTNKTHHE